MVEHGDIDYAVCDEDIKRASVDSFPQIDIEYGHQFQSIQFLGGKQQSPALRDSLNNWIKSFMKTKDFKQIYRSYYKRTNFACHDAPNWIFCIYLQRGNKYMNMSNKVIKWGFMGCGNANCNPNKKQWPAFKKMKGSEVVAVMSRDGAKAQAYAEKHSQMV